MYNQNDIIKMANAMQKEREIQAEINRQSPKAAKNEFEHTLDMICDGFERAFKEIFAGDEGYERPKHKTVVDIHADHGVSIHDF